MALPYPNWDTNAFDVLTSSKIDQLGDNDDYLYSLWNPGVAWTSWTPTWTATSGSPAIGNGTWDNKYIQIGKFVTGYLRFTAGSTTNFGTGDWRFTLPVTVTPPSSSSYYWPVGTWTATALASGGNYSGTMNTSVEGGVTRLIGFNDLPSAAAAVGPNIPATFQNGSIFNLFFIVMAA